jgi:hypothetical protein
MPGSSTVDDATLRAQMLQQEANLQVLRSAISEPSVDPQHAGVHRSPEHAVRDGGLASV